MISLRRSAIWLVLPVLACSPSDERSVAERPAESKQGALISVVDSSTVLASYELDTVLLIRGEEFNSMVWHRANVARHWRVDSLLSSEPSARLALVDRDSAPDLFFTIRWEEFILGELWLARGQTAAKVFSSANDACRIPELRDVNLDGTLDVIDWRAGALDAEECAGDVLARACQDAFPTEWPDVWLQSLDGDFKRDSIGARTFYRGMAVRFADGARELRAGRDAPGGLPPGLDRCSGEMVASLEAMAKRAVAISLLR